ncbi:hypothetical protein [Mumia quercus]|uniref:hypothetical protein n=1 Tax=Mumia quercus TaxID=2976125 RepID=UPI0021D30EB1|nr:hypothetical protein [Mumia quercus]
MITTERPEIGTSTGIAHPPALTRSMLRGRVALDRLISLAEPRPQRACRESTARRRNAEDTLSPMLT